MERPISPRSNATLAARKSVSLSNGQQFLACLKCGLTWNELDPAELLELLETRGTEETQEAVAKKKGGLR